MKEDFYEEKYARYNLNRLFSELKIIEGKIRLESVASRKNHLRKMKVSIITVIMMREKRCKKQ